MSFGELRHIDVSYDKKNLILEDLNLDIHQGELLSLLGPSGCGKTTTLRVIAGLIEATGGTFLLEGKDMTHVPVHKRDFGIVFQSYALFPHLTVFENIAFGLKLRKIDSATIATQVAKMVDICGITGLEQRFPKQLSGGQRQRVALARALVIEPKLLLLDEPLSNLDAQLRLQMRSSIKRIQQELGITTVFVTHDQEECFSISDRVAIMQKGKIEQCDSPEKIYSNPATEMIARFVGFKNLFAIDKAKVAQVSIPADKDKATLFCIRPEDVQLSLAKDESFLSGSIEVRTYLGKGYQYEVKTDLGLVTIASSQEPAFPVGSAVSVKFPQEKLVFLHR
ncbi:ABC-type spermidine/putrescine transport system, ATPase component [Sphaerochaeta pleomorpha str. Grapes]|uniref:ABC-type spermidine/putrescine transport system, ATPase component n=1 Tax=Sphaerochaeta pleomorpha (strain ATCC BAA-1885 / DSM 22778 / Grapes) TaxID=158190 RepID=G8QQS5_SPHPG|nr:ABC transporter ATP-binding protein [Sphaerochaeta pleomorpha]AEV28706.1 ABC-type spermidine/putrescine transport system, ATPase component [Sphaerochaeta pleomorpha str. Grapes]